MSTRNAPNREHPDVVPAAKMASAAWTAAINVAKTAVVATVYSAATGSACPSKIAPAPWIIVPCAGRMAAPTPTSVSLGAPAPRSPTPASVDNAIRRANWPVNSAYSETRMDVRFADAPKDLSAGLLKIVDSL